MSALDAVKDAQLLNYWLRQVNRLQSENARYREALEANWGQASLGMMTDDAEHPLPWPEHARRSLEIIIDQSRQALSTPNPTEGEDYIDPGPDPQPVNFEWLKGVTGYETRTETISTPNPTEGT